MKKLLISNTARAMGLAITAAVLLAAVETAKADTVTNIDISSYTTGNWSGEIDGSSIAAAPTNGNQGTGLTFSNWNGTYDEVTTGNSQIISFSSVSLNSDAVVNTLMNTFYGAGNTQAVITFTNNLSQTVQYSLVGNQTIRDYNNAVYANDLQGYNTDPTLGDVTTQNWWNNYSSSGAQRLDAQTFVLPSSWAGTDLVSITIDNPSDSNDDTVLSAIQVDDLTPTAAPEPSAVALLGIGLAGLCVLAGRSKAA